MAERELDALVVRAPDNVLYLSNYWCMKGYDVVVFPREGEPTLVVMEPQLDEAAHTAWTDDLRPFRGYDPDDPRPAWARSTEWRRTVCRERGLERIGLELSQGTQVGGSDGRRADGVHPGRSSTPSARPRTHPRCSPRRA